MTDKRLFAPSTARNREAILAVARAVFPPSGTVLEIAAGAGEHAVYFAAALPQLTFLPSDPSPEARASIADWIAHAGAANVLPPLDLDAGAPLWPVQRADALYCINMVHISPWRATQGLFRNAAVLLPAQAPLLLYGPYRRGGVHTAESNAAFDESLQAHDPEWGVRDLEAVEACAAQRGFALERIVEMPANNFSLVFRAGG